MVRYVAAWASPSPVPPPRGVPADGRIAFWGGWVAQLIFMDLDRLTFSRT